MPQTQQIPGPFKGINDGLLEADPATFEDAWNVEISDGRVSRAPGLGALVRTFDVKPARVLQGLYAAADKTYHFTSALGGTGDFTSTVTDGDSTTSMLLIITDVADPLSTALFVGMPYPFYAIKLTLSVVNTAACAVVPGVYVAGGWSEAGVLSADGTSAAGVSLAQTGTIVLDANAAVMDNWTPTTIMGKRLYWVRLRWSHVIDAGVRVNEVRCPMVGKAGSTYTTINSRPVPNGLYAWQRPYGNKRTFATLDSAGYYNGRGPADTYSYPTLLGDSRMIEYDENDSTWRAVELPYAAFGSHPGARWSFAAYSANGLVATNGYGPPVAIDATKASVLGAAQGTDRLTGAYLSAAPWGRFLAVLQSRLVLAGGPLTPYTIFWSAPADGPLADLVEAPLRGANHWPADQNVDVGTDTGHKISSMTCTESELVAFTASSIWRGPPPFVNKVVSDIGCTAPASVVQVGGSTFFLATDGYYVLQGGSVQKVSGGIDRSWKHLFPTPSLFTAHAVHVKQQQQIKLWVESFKSIYGGFPTQVGLIYNYTGGGWTKTGYPLEVTETYPYPSFGAACAYEDDNGVETVLVAGFSTYSTAEAPQFWYEHDDNQWALLSRSETYALASSPAAIIATVRMKSLTASRMLVGALRLQAGTTGATLNIAPIFDDTDWRTVFTTGATLAQAVVLSEPNDPQYTRSSGNHAATINTDKWWGARQTWVRASFARRCEYVQFVIYQTLGSLPLALDIGAMEMDYNPIPGKPPTRLLNP